MRKLYYVLSIIICLGVISCAKDGEIGPEGPKGENGENGQDGENGKNGATILNGNVNPSDDQGEVGDFFINVDSYVMFGPKIYFGLGRWAKYFR